MMQAPERCEIAVLGSGPGGAITASVLAEAGRDVVLLEEGPWLDLESMPPFSSAEMRAKYRNGGITATLGSPRIAYAEGRCVGGGSEINSGLYHRTPPDALARWRTTFSLAAASEAELEAHFAACENALSVSLAPGRLPAASERLRVGAEREGWRSLEVPRWYRWSASADEPGAMQTGERQSMTRTFVPRAVRAGCRVATGMRAHRLAREGRAWHVHCLTPKDDGTSALVRLRADSVFVACGAIQTPALLQRSGIRRNVGRSLHMHPTVKVVAEFDEPVNGPGMGVPAHQVKEFSPAMSFGCSISEPPHLALALADHPASLRDLDERWQHLAVYYAMTTGGRGQVWNLPVFRDPLVYFRLDTEELGELALALERLCQCLLAAGAKALYPSIAGSAVLHSLEDLARLPRTLPRDRTSLMTIHTFSTCPMGEDRTTCVADSFGRVHGVPGLHIADASLLCDAPGVNPQGSIMAFARRNALHFLGQL